MDDLLARAEAAIAGLQGEFEASTAQRVRRLAELLRDIEDFDGPDSAVRE